MANIDDWKPTNEIVWVKDTFWNAPLDQWIESCPVRCYTSRRKEMIGSFVQIRACDRDHSFVLRLSDNAISEFSSQSSEPESQLYAIVDTWIQLRKFKLTTIYNGDKAYLCVEADIFEVRYDDANAPSNTSEVCYLKLVQLRIKKICEKKTTAETCSKLLKELFDDDSQDAEIDFDESSIENTDTSSNIDRAIEYMTKDSENSTEEDIVEENNALNENNRLTEADVIADKCKMNGNASDANTESTVATAARNDGDVVMQDNIEEQMGEEDISDLQDSEGSNGYINEGSFIDDVVEVLERFYSELVQPTQQAEQQIISTNHEEKDSHSENSNRVELDSLPQVDYITIDSETFTEEDIAEENDAVNENNRLTGADVIAEKNKMNGNASDVNTESTVVTARNDYPIVTEDIQEIQVDYTLLTFTSPKRNKFKRPREDGECSSSTRHLDVNATEVSDSNQRNSKRKVYPSDRMKRFVIDYWKNKVRILNNEHQANI